MVPAPKKEYKEKYKMKLKRDNLSGTIVKKTDVYTVIDNTSLNNLVVSKTILRPAKSTSGHKHDDQEEVYYFIYGQGNMTVGSQTFEVSAGETVLIPAGEFHKVNNTSNTEELIFICVFDGARSH